MSSLECGEFVAPGFHVHLDGKLGGMLNPPDFPETFRALDEALLRRHAGMGATGGYPS